jgi:folate-binding protein YgfZ
MGELTEYRAIREGAALVARHDRSVIRLGGPDRAAFLHGLVTNDIKGLEPGSGCYAAFLTPQGRLVADVRVFETGEELLLVLPARVAGAMRERLAGWVITEDVEVRDLSDTWTILSVYGPAAGPTLERLVEPAAGSAALAAWPPFRHARARLGSVSTILAASDEFGVRGFDCFVTREAAPAVEARLVEAGVLRVGWPAVEAVRVESGIPAFGVDMDESTLPLEVGLDARAISFTKGCYVGQEVIVRVRDRGHGRVARRLVGVVFEGDARPARGEAVRVGAREVGRLTSVVWSPALRRVVALALVYRDVAEPGTLVDVEHDGQPIRATIVALPFVSAPSATPSAT